MFWIFLGGMWILVGLAIAFLDSDHRDAGAIGVLIGILLIMINLEALEDYRKVVDHETCNTKYIKIITLDGKDTISVTYIHKVDSTLSN